MAKKDQESAQRLIAAKQKAALQEAVRAHQERLVQFAAIDRATLASRLLHRYAEAFARAGMEQDLEFGISDALETGHGMGYPIRTRTVFVFSPALEKPPLHLGGRVFQIDKGGGFEEAYVDFELTQNARENFALRYQALSKDQQHTAPRPYWHLGPNDVFDITTRNHVTPNTSQLTNRDSAFLFGGNSSHCFRATELEIHQAAIQAYFSALTTDKLAKRRH